MDISKIKKERPIAELINFGILNIDKPAGCTSFDVVNKIRRLFNLKKCGHFGTLDPNVNGVLPVCLGNACKIQDLFMHHDKTYIGKMLIHKEVSEKELKEAVKKFVGKIKQLPPRISRVKRQLREREIMKFEVTAFNPEKREAEFIAEVEAGTYIRKLVDDLGKVLGVGCQMIELRRIKAGLFSSEDKEFSSIEEVEKAVEEYKESKNEKSGDKLREMLIPAEIILKLIPEVEVKSEFVGKLKNGSPLFKEMLEDYYSDIKIIETKENFAVVSGDRLIEIAKFSDKFENKSILAKPEAVLI